MKKKYVHALGLWVGLAIANLGVAQNVGVNATGATPNASTILDLNTGNTFTSPNGKGLLIPNVALTGTGDATTVTSPATSLMVYNTATAGSGATAVTPGYYYWDGTKWVQFQSSSNASQDWKLTGNAGTTAGTNFVGTTDAVDFVTKTNNTERMRVTSAGNVGIGTSAPSASLSIVATATNTGFQLKDGSQAAGNVLVSDANGIGSWQNVAENGIPATYVSNGNAGPFTSDGSIHYINEYYVLPSKGTYIIYFNNVADANTVAVTGGYSRVHLSSSPTVDIPITTATGIGNPSEYFPAVAVGTPFVLSSMPLIIRIDNPTTVYVWQGAYLSGATTWTVRANAAPANSFRIGYAKRISN